MPTFIEFCAMDFENKIFKLHIEKCQKKPVSGAVTPTSLDKSVLKILA